MVAAVFHFPPDPATPAAAADGMVAVNTPPGAARPPRAARAPFDSRGLALLLLPPVFGPALQVGMWGLLTCNRTTFPTPAAAFEAPAKLFADPFYDKGPNNQGIG